LAVGFGFLSRSRRDSQQGDVEAREGDPLGVTKIQGRCFLSTNATEDEIFGLTDIEGPKKAIN
jgi:hypothetical protein